MSGWTVNGSQVTINRFEFIDKEGNIDPVTESLISTLEAVIEEVEDLKNDLEDKTSQLETAHENIKTMYDSIDDEWRLEFEDVGPILSWAMQVREI